jgi:hypothetical protein
MAPGQKKKGFWLEFLLISLLLFLLITARSQANRAAEGATKAFSSVGAQRTFLAPPAVLK